MTLLFERDKSVISRHIRKIFEEGELERAAVVAKNATTAADGKTYQVDYYNLDVIISVGYRVKSRRGVQFRQWATQTLRQHLVQGYTLHEKRLQERGIEIGQALALLQQTLANQSLVNAEGAAVLAVVQDYAKSWSLLHKATTNKTLPPSPPDSTTCARSPSRTSSPPLPNSKPRSSPKARRRNCSASRAAHLLYFVIKNHPLADGNKRSGAFLFLWYLRLNAPLLGKPVEQLITDNTLVALALLVAESLPAQKDLIIRLIEHFIPLREG